MIFNDEHVFVEIDKLKYRIAELESEIKWLKAGQTAIAIAVDEDGEQLYPVEVNSAVAISQILKHLGLSLQQVIPDAPKTTYKLVIKNDSKE